MFTTIFKAEETVVEFDVIEPIFVSHIGRIDRMGDLVRFLLCDNRQVDGTHVLVPRLCVLRRVSDVLRDGLMIRRHMVEAPTILPYVDLPRLAH